MIRKLVAVVCAAFTVTAIVGTSLASSNGQAKPIIACSDPGRSCSVDRNCCSGSCVHGNCK